MGRKTLNFAGVAVDMFLILAGCEQKGARDLERFGVSKILLYPGFDPQNVVLVMFAQQIAE